MYAGDVGFWRLSCAEGYRKGDGARRGPGHGLGTRDGMGPARVTGLSPPRRYKVSGPGLDAAAQEMGASEAGEGDGPGRRGPGPRSLGLISYDTPEPQGAAAAAPRVGSGESVGGVSAGPMGKAGAGAWP